MINYPPTPEKEHFLNQINAPKRQARLILVQSFINHFNKLFALALNWGKPYPLDGVHMLLSAFKHRQ